MSPPQGSAWRCPLRTGERERTSGGREGCVEKRDEKKEEKRVRERKKGEKERREREKGRETDRLREREERKNRATHVFVTPDSLSVCSVPWRRAERGLRCPLFECWGWVESTHSRCVCVCGGGWIITPRPPG